MKLEILDVNSILHAAQNVEALKGDRVRGCPVAGIKLLTRKLSYMLSTHSNVVCAFDSKTTRKVIMPEYKSGRKKVPEVILQSELAYKLLNNAGITCLKIADMEADDIIFNVVEQFRPVSYEINIHTSDMDLAHNIIDPRTNVIAVNNLSLNVNYNNFTEVFSEVDYRLPINLITTKKIFLGDSSDGISQFISDDRRNGKVLLKQFLEIIMKNSLYDPIINRTRQLFELIAGELGLTENDLNVLSNRCDVFYPRQKEISVEPSNLDNIDLDYYKGMVKSLKDLYSCRSLVYSGDSNSSVDELLFDYGNKFRSGEFHVDNNLSFEEDPFDFTSSSVFVRDL